MGIARTWIVTAEQARAVAALADRYGVNHSAMVRYLLGRALFETEWARHLAQRAIAESLAPATG